MGAWVGPGLPAPQRGGSRARSGVRSGDGVGGSLAGPGRAAAPGPERRPGRRSGEGRAGAGCGAAPDGRPTPQRRPRRLFGAASLVGMAAYALGRGRTTAFTRAANVADRAPASSPWPCWSWSAGRSGRAAPACRGAADATAPIRSGGLGASSFAAVVARGSWPSTPPGAAGPPIPTLSSMLDAVDRYYGLEGAHVLRLAVPRVRPSCGEEDGAARVQARAPGSARGAMSMPLDYAVWAVLGPGHCSPSSRPGPAGSVAGPPRAWCCERLATGPFLRVAAASWRGGGSAGTSSPADARLAAAGRHPWRWDDASHGDRSATVGAPPTATGRHRT